MLLGKGCCVEGSKITTPAGKFLAHLERWHRSELRRRKYLTHAFVVEEEEQLVFDDGTADGASELISLQQAGLGRAREGPFIGVQRIVAPGTRYKLP